MLKHDWREIEKHLLAVLTLDSAQRRAYLEEACAGQATLKQEIEALLASEREMGDFLESDVLTQPPKPVLNLPQLKVGQELGPYRIEREIGSGGMSVVYSATREDLQRKVAIKVIKRGMDSLEILRRFVGERRILAQLNHPSIAQLYDGGTTAEGLPYFVMEYVDGIPIDEYCDQHRLRIEDRIALFRKVCAAVHYAHQNLVVHRDLKPGNILVTSEGIPKLLDFGIAKLLDPQPAFDGSEPTVAWMRLMTPNYASPEQVRGEPITTACDVYSLGVLLYKLLTDQLPFRFKTGLPQEMEDVFLHHRPPKPSLAVGRAATVSWDPIGTAQARQTNPGKLVRKLQGDLDTILLSALRVDPEERYRSVLVFAEDLRRSRLGLTITAREETFLYRASAFLRRNKFSVLVSFLVLSLVLGFAVLAMVNAERAEHEKAQTEQVAEFLVALFDSSAAGSGNSASITARELLERGAERVEEDLEEQPEIRATLADTIGRAYNNLQLNDQAIPLFENALALRREALGEDHPRVATTRRNLAIALRDAGELEASAQEMERALALFRLANKGSEEVAKTLSEFAHLRILQGQIEEGTAFAREALDIRLRLFPKEDPRIGRSRSILATCLLDLGKAAEAEVQYEKAIMDSNFSNAYAADRAKALNGLGFLLADRGEFERAEAMIHEGLAIHLRLFGSGHPLYADSLSVLSFALVQQGRFPEALPVLQKSIDIQTARYGPNHHAIAREQYNLAWVQASMGLLEEAETSYRQVLQLALQLVDEGHPRVANVHSGLASVLQAQGKTQEAEKLFLQAIRNLSVRLGPGHLFLAYARTGLGSLLCDRGDFIKGEAIIRQAVDVIEEGHDEKHWRRVHLQGELAACLVGQNKGQEAEALFTQLSPALEALRPHAIPDRRVRDHIARWSSAQPTASKAQAPFPDL